MGRWWRTSACERAWQWISLELDGELSQIETAALERHLDGCGRCRELAVGTRSFTHLLRAAPLVELEHPILVSVPRIARRRVARRAAAGLAFAALTAAVVLGGIILPGAGSNSHSALSFRSVQEQKRFAHHEAQRLEPAVFQVPKAPPAVE